MYHDMNGGAWLHMSIGAAFWILMPAGAVYVAVRLAQQHARRS
jgi:hypothetical protein